MRVNIEDLKNGNGAIEVNPEMDLIDISILLIDGDTPSGPTFHDGRLYNFHGAPFCGTFEGNFYSNGYLNPGVVYYSNVCYKDGVRFCGKSREGVEYLFGEKYYEKNSPVNREMYDAIVKRFKKFKVKIPKKNVKGAQVHTVKGVIRY